MKSTAGNPLQAAFDAATNDPLHARQMREGYLAGMRPPMGGMGRGGAMMDPMMAKGVGMDAAWGESVMRPPMPMGPMLGAAMPDQLRRHMEGRGMDPGAEVGFFQDGPMGMSGGPDWGAEFAQRPHGPRGPAMMPGPQADWAAQFNPGPRAMAGGPASSSSAVLEAAFAQAGPMAAGPMGGEAAMRGPMGMGMGPMMGAMRPGMPMMGMMGGAMSSMAGPSMMAPMSAPASSSQVPVQAPVVAEAMPEVKEAEAPPVEVNQDDLSQAAEMVRMLRESGNPKFANSQFVSFIDKVSKGDLQFKENQTVVDRNGNEVDWDSLYDTAAATATEQDKNDLDAMWARASGGNPELEAAWQAAREAAPDLELDEMWKKSGVGMMDGMWNLAGDQEEQNLLEQAWFGEENVMEQIWNGGQKNNEYEFQKDNPYLDHPDPLAEAIRLIAEGKDREALLALEAEITRNPESSEGWRMLGQLYAELDQDVEAIQCLRKGHEVDPYNLDSLLALGVSCTNELDQLPALRYLRQWVENHEEHQVLVHGVEPPAEYEYEAWRMQVTHLFTAAAEANPMDADVFVALGVMENINRNYDAAIRALATACRLRPNDHTVWNKLGATLANSGKSEQAVVAYHQGLQLKPNYARSWSNLAIAHANLGQHTDAARFYLSSLVLNPEATHIWNFLHSAVLNMEGSDLKAYEAIDRRDLAAATKVIDGVLDPAQLPKPTSELPQPPDEILGSIGL